MAQRPRQRKEEPIERLFKVNDDPHRKIFDVRPDHIIEPFLRFVREIGKPHEFEWIVHSKPLPGLKPVALKRFSVPKVLRTKVGMAPCPICCLFSPKYYDGVLCWFPQERALRAAGCDCGHEFFEGNEYANALAELDEREADQRAFDFLVANLETVAGVMQQIDGVRHRARMLDGYRTIVRKAVKPKTATAVAKAGENGGLVIEQVGWVPVMGRDGLPELDEDGEIKRKPVASVVKTYRVNGTSIFNDPRLSEAILYNAYRTLEPLNFTGDDEIIAAFQEWGGPGMREAVSEMRRAWKLIEEARKIFADTKRFLSKKNINDVGEWADDPRAPARFRICYTDDGELHVHEWREPPKKVPALPNAFFSFPETPELTES